MSDVFLSYSRRDTRLAERVRDGLSADGLDVWMDVEAIELADDWMDRMNPDRFRVACTASLEWVSQHAPLRGSEPSRDLADRGAGGSIEAAVYRAKDSPISAAEKVEKLEAAASLLERRLIASEDCKRTRRELLG